MQTVTLLLLMLITTSCNKVAFDANLASGTYTITKHGCVETITIDTKRSTYIYKFETFGQQEISTTTGKLSVGTSTEQGGGLITLHNLNSPTLEFWDGTDKTRPIKFQTGTISYNYIKFNNTKQLVGMPDINYILVETSPITK